MFSLPADNPCAPSTCTFLVGIAYLFQVLSALFSFNFAIAPSFLFFPSFTTLSHYLRLITVHLSRYHPGLLHRLTHLCSLPAASLLVTLVRLLSLIAIALVLR